MLRRCRSGDLRRAEVRGDWPKFRPALVLTFNGEEQVAIRHTHWMPFLREVYVAQLMDACRRYHQKTGRRISFEYAMIDGVNDSPEQAKQLAALMKGVGGHVNLIPLNPVKERGFSATPPERVRAFMKALEESGVNVTLRRRLGGDVDASCGQLRRSAST